MTYEELKARYKVSVTRKTKADVKEFMRTMSITEVRRAKITKTVAGNYRIQY